MEQGRLQGCGPVAAVLPPGVQTWLAFLLAPDHPLKVCFVMQTVLVTCSAAYQLPHTLVKKQ